MQTLQVGLASFPFPFHDVRGEDPDKEVTVVGLHGFLLLMVQAGLESSRVGVSMKEKHSASVQTLLELPAFGPAVL